MLQHCVRLCQKLSVNIFSSGTVRISDEVVWQGAGVVHVSGV